jgi:hypothetical protein
VLARQRHYDVNATALSRCFEPSQEEILGGRPFRAKD